MNKNQTVENSSIHNQWPKAMGFPDGITCLKDYEACLHFLRGLGEQIIFRGEHRYYEKHVAPSCFRFGNDWPMINETSNLTKAELKEVRRMQFRKFRRLFSINWNSPTWIGLTQHYGGNTRLVDISYDKYVGLFFACWDFRNPPIDIDCDGWIYVFSKGAFRPMTVSETEAGKYDLEQGITKQFQNMFNENKHSKLHSNIGHLYTPKIDKTYNKRMNAQRGAFLWWQPPYEKFPHQIIPIKVNKDAKKNILEELGNHGVTVESLFPDEEGINQSKKARINSV